jgi:hypothetical protein
MGTHLCLLSPSYPCPSQRAVIRIRGDERERIGCTLARCRREHGEQRRGHVSSRREVRQVALLAGNKGGKYGKRHIQYLNQEPK